MATPSAVASRKETAPTIKSPDVSAMETVATVAVGPGGIGVPQAMVLAKAKLSAKLLKASVAILKAGAR